MPLTLKDRLNNLSDFGVYKTQLINNPNKISRIIRTGTPNNIITREIRPLSENIPLRERRQSLTDSSITNPSASKRFLQDIINEVFQNEPILKTFYNILYSPKFQPDINGYTLIFLIPPHLSGYMEDPRKSMSGLFFDVSKMSVFLAVDMTPPNISVEYDETTGSSTSVVYASELRVSKQTTVSYIDDSNLSVFSYHKIWADYIRDVTHGSVEPSDEYLKDDFVELDYVGSIYCIRFRPSIGDKLENNILYIGKAVGVFPISLPDKEVIGTRQSNELTIVPISYMCSEYRQYVYNEDANPIHNHSWVLEDFKADVETMYH